MDVKWYNLLRMVIKVKTYLAISPVAKHPS